MGAHGVNGSDEEEQDPLARTVSDLAKGAAALGEQTGYGNHFKWLAGYSAFLSPSAKREDNTATHVEGEGMSQSDSNMTFAELRAQLAEARSDGKLAEAIGRSDARHAEVVGRVDTGFAEIRGQIATVNARLEGIERTTGGIKTTVIVTGLTAVALIVAILTYGQTWFGIGLSTRDAVKSEVAGMQQQTKPPVSTSP